MRGLFAKFKGLLHNLNMEGTPKQTPENSSENKHNFHEIAEKRKELRKAIAELGDNDSLASNVIFDKHYKKPLEEANEQASEFRVADFGSLTEAKEALKKQKRGHEAEALEDGADIDYKAILEETPKISEAQSVMKNIVDLKDFRMRRMFEILSSGTSLSTKKRNEAVLKTIK